MRKYIAIMALLCIMLLSGCTENGGNLIVDNTPTPAITPEPTPPPIHVLVVTDCDESQAEGFFEAIEEAAGGTGWVLTYKANAMAESLAGYDGIIALCTNESTSIAPLRASAQNGVSVSVVDITSGNKSADGIAYASYDHESDYDVLFETALNYPPHDTPVRFLAILKTEGTILDGLYQNGINEGKVFNRASMYLNGEGSVKDFMDKYLNKFIAGMLDGILVEDFETAKEVIAILNEKGRDDAEVFVLGNVNEARGMLSRYVFPVAVGMNINAEASKQVENIKSMLNGGEGESYTFKASVIEFGGQ